MTRGDIHDIVITACILAGAVAAFLIAGFALGWLEANLNRPRVRFVQGRALGALAVLLSGARRQRQGENVPAALGP